MKRVTQSGEARAAATRQVTELMRDLLLGVRLELDERLRPHGVTSAQLKVLRQIDDGGRLTGARVARLCHVTPQTVQALMARSERSGLVRRGTDPENERLVLWSLTPAGKRLMRRAEAIFEEVQAQVWAGLSAEQLAKLGEVLGVGVQNLRCGREA